MAKYEVIDGKGINLTTVKVCRYTKISKDAFEGSPNVNIRLYDIQ